MDEVAVPRNGAALLELIESLSGGFEIIYVRD